MFKSFEIIRFKIEKSFAKIWSIVVPPHFGICKKYIDLSKEVLILLGTNLKSIFII